MCMVSLKMSGTHYLCKPVKFLRRKFACRKFSGNSPQFLRVGNFRKFADIFACRKFSEIRRDFCESLKISTEMSAEIAGRDRPRPAEIARRNRRARSAETGRNRPPRSPAEIGRDRRRNRRKNGGIYSYIFRVRIWKMRRFKLKITHCHMSYAYAKLKFAIFLGFLNHMLNCTMFTEVARSKILCAH